MRQVLGAISQFEKASLVAKLRAARERKAAAGGRGSGRFTYAMKVPTYHRAETKKVPFTSKPCQFIFDLR